MAVKDNLRRIRGKTYIFFFIVIALSLIILLGLSFFEYSRLKFVPDHNKYIKYTEDKNIDNRIHLQYSLKFVRNNTFRLFFKNLFFISLVYFCLCYSIIINKEDSITSEGRDLLFSQVISHGLYILLALTVLYFFAIDRFIPAFEQNIGGMKNSTLQSMILLENADEKYYEKDYEGALPFYEEYFLIIENDEKIKDRIRYLRNSIKSNKFDEAKIMRDKITKNENMPDKIPTYYELANLYYDKQDYITAWYYYQFVYEVDSGNRTFVKERIDSIKKYLEYENSMKDSDERLKIPELEKMMSDKEKEFKKLYKMKRTALRYYEAGKLHDAYFIYREMLGINPKLRDVINMMDDVYKELAENSCEIHKAHEAKIYPGKKNFVFFISDYKLIFVNEIIKRPGEQIYYFYDVSIIELDIKHNIKSVTSAPYARSISPFEITLYSFSKYDKSMLYKPIKKFAGSNKTVEYNKSLEKLNVDINTIYNFSYDYRKTFYFSIFDLIKLLNIKNQDGKKVDFNIGLNNDFIKTAIVDKISHIFLFFIINLLFIGIAWKLKATYMSGIPILHYIFMIAVPVFLYFFVSILQSIVTMFYSILTMSVSFPILIVIFILSNLLLLIISLFYTASNK